MISNYFCSVSSKDEEREKKDESGSKKKESEGLLVKENNDLASTSTSSSSSSNPAASFFQPRKKRKVTLDSVKAADPKKIMCWNVNGLFHRINMSGMEIQKFLESNMPDIIFLSEVRFKASSPNRRGELDSRDKRSREESGLLKRSLASGCFKTYPICKVSLSDKRYAGTMLLVREGGPKPIKIWFGLPNPTTMEKVPHDENGRIILTEWRSFFLLHTYSPNNGIKQDSFARRREWDAKVTAWLEAMAEHPERKPVIYVGDLNCAPTDRDLSHPSWFNRQYSPSDSGDPDDVGQPGCTNNEQKRFLEMLRRGKLVDAFRAMEDRGVKRGDEIEAPIYSWRGRPGDKSPEIGRFFKKGMRIDHLLVSESLPELVKSAEIMGKGFSCEDPTFLASDHCPLMLELNP